MRLLVFAIALVASCSHPQRPPMSTSPCKDAIAGFASADPSRLRPLPATCTLADVSSVLHSKDSVTRGGLGTRKDTLDIHRFSSERLPQIYVWVDSTGHVVLIDAEWPPAAAEDYHKALGEPDQRLDYAWRGDVMKAAEQVWLSRGAVLVASPDLKGPLRIGVFAPCTLDEYKQNLQFADTEDIDEG